MAPGKENDTTSQPQDINASGTPTTDNDKSQRGGIYASKWARQKEEGGKNVQSEENKKTQTDVEGKQEEQRTASEEVAESSVNPAEGPDASNDEITARREQEKADFELAKKLQQSWDDRQNDPNAMDLDSPPLYQNTGTEHQDDPDAIDIDSNGANATPSDSGPTTNQQQKEQWFLCDKCHIPRAQSCVPSQEHFLTDENGAYLPLCLYCWERNFDDIGSQKRWCKIGGHEEYRADFSGGGEMEDDACFECIKLRQEAIERERLTQPGTTSPSQTLPEMDTLPPESIPKASPPDEGLSENNQLQGDDKPHPQGDDKTPSQENDQTPPQGNDKAIQPSLSISPPTTPSPSSLQVPPETLPSTPRGSTAEGPGVSFQAPSNQPPQSDDMLVNVASPNGTSQQIGFNDNAPNVARPEVPKTSTLPKSDVGKTPIRSEHNRRVLSPSLPEISEDDSEVEESAEEQRRLPQPNIKRGPKDGSIWTKERKELVASQLSPKQRRDGAGQSRRKRMEQIHREVREAKNGPPTEATDREATKTPENETMTIRVAQHVAQQKTPHEKHMDHIYHQVKAKEAVVMSSHFLEESPDGGSLLPVSDPSQWKKKLDRMKSRHEAVLRKHFGFPDGGLSKLQQLQQAQRFAEVRLEAMMIFAEHWEEARNNLKKVTNERDQLLMKEKKCRELLHGKGGNPSLYNILRLEDIHIFVAQMTSRYDAIAIQEFKNDRELHDLTKRYRVKSEDKNFKDGVITLRSRRGRLLRYSGPSPKNQRFRELMEDTERRIEVVRRSLANFLEVCCK